MAEEIKKEKKPYIFAVGRRRASIARVRLYEDIKTGVVLGESIVKKGDVFVNGKPIQEVYTRKVDQAVYLEPLRVTNALTRYAITIKTVGGGVAGQLDAIVFGVARALERADKGHRAILKKHKLLTRDARVRQRRKVGMGGKSRRKKQSPKR